MYNLIERLNLENRVIDKFNKKDLDGEQKAIAACMIYSGLYEVAINYIEGCLRGKNGR